MKNLPMMLLFFIFCLSIFNSLNAVSNASNLSSSENPFTPKASLLRFWNREINNSLPISPFFLSKISPLSAVESATFAKLAAENSLSTHLIAFCSSAKLFCFPDALPASLIKKVRNDSNFVSYTNKNFTNYGTVVSGLDSFTNYSGGDITRDSFRRYGHETTDHVEKFSNYAPEVIVADQTFNSYGSHAVIGKGEFNNYQKGLEMPNLQFSLYADDSTERRHAFSSYTEEVNAGNESFTNYGRNGLGAHNDFETYAGHSNSIFSEFNNYGRKSSANNDTFKLYGKEGNVPNNDFQSYGDRAFEGSENFINYGNESNDGFNTFKSYAKNGDREEVNFSGYGQSYHGGDSFTGYSPGQGAMDQAIGFNKYGVGSTDFNDYAKVGVNFSSYTNGRPANLTASSRSSGNMVSRWVEPGKFFRESMLKEGTVMPMPDVADKMPKRSFLPRNIVSKLPFSTSKINELRQIFHVSDNSIMERIILDALNECQRAPSPGETKRCVGSAEDMIDFAISVLSQNVAVRTTENVRGSNKSIMIGSVKGINGGKVTKAVSCHQSLYPYLLYYCHSVPKVRVYEADILDPNSKIKMNQGVAVCHLDTSAWSPTHGAFVALGWGPGRIEVCHWIFENDMTWTIAECR